MRRIRRLFGNHHNQKNQNHSGKNRSLFKPHLEALEERRLLSINNPLACIQTDVVDGTQMKLTVVDGSDPAVLAMYVSADNGSSVNPAVPLISRDGGAPVTPIHSTANIAGSTDSLVTAELGPGTYTVTIKTEGGTAGPCKVDVVLLGDVDGNGSISDAEYIQASAAAVQDSGYWNSFTAMYYSSMGYDLNVDQYHPALDVDGDGRIDGFDLNNINQNVGVVLTNDTIAISANDPPQFTPVSPTAQMDEDSGTLDIDLRDYVDDEETADADLTFDNVSSLQGTATLDGDGHTVHFTPAANYNGTANITFEVTDVGESGAESNTEQFMLDVVVTPVNDTPVAAADSAAVNADQTVEIDVLANDNDVDTGDTTPDVLSIQEPLTTPAGFEGTLSVVDGKIVFDPTGSEVIKQLTDGETLVQTFEYTVVDSGNPALTDTATVTITVTGINDVPQATPPSPTAEMAEDSGTIDINLRDYVDDVETADNALTFSNVSSLQGTATLDADGHTVHFTPTANFNGTAEVNFDVADTANSPANVHTVQMTAEITVTPVNDLPQAESTDTINTDEDTYVDIDLRTRVSDVETAENDLTFVVKNPQNGTVELLDDGYTARFTPEANYNILDFDLYGPASFEFEVTDGGDNGATAETVDFTVNIDVAPVNDTPTVETVTAINTSEDTSIVVDLCTRIQDVETDDADLIFNLEDPSTHSTPATIITKDEGTLELLENASGNDYEVRFTPAANFNGATFFIFWVTDGGDGSSAAITMNFPIVFSVTAVNDAPVAADDSAAANADQTVEIDVLANDSDVDEGDTLSIVEPLTTPTGFEGTLSVVDGKIVFDPTGSEVIKQLAVGQTLVQTFDYTVQDSGNPTLSDTATVTITVTGVNDDPTAENDGDATTADTPIGGSLAGLVDDIDDGDTLTFGPASLTSTQGATVTIDETTGDWTYDPSGASALIALAEGETLDDTFTYTVSDNHGGSATATITITVTGVNEDPIAANSTGFTTAGTTTFGALSGFVGDPDTNDTLTYALSGDAPLGAVDLDANTGDWTYDPSGVAAFFALADGETFDDTFTYTVTDNHGATATATVTITVTGVNDLPQFTPVSPTAEMAEDAGTIDIDLRDYVDDVETADADLAFGNVSSLQGTATLDADGHTVHFTPTADFNGMAEVTFEVTDTANSPANVHTVQMTAEINVTPVNDDPTAVDDPTSGTTNVPYDEDTVLDVLANDTDIDGDDLTIIGVDTTGIDGSVAIAGDGLSLIYTPSGSYEGEETFTYTISDGNGGTATATVRLNVVGNHDPVADDDDYSPSEDELLNGNVLDNDSDSDGDDLSVTDVTYISGDLVNFPPTVNADGSFSYDPRSAYQNLAAGETKTGVFEYTISDGNGGTATAQVTITVVGVNDAPTSGHGTGNTDADTTTAGSLFSLVNDVDTSDTLTFGPTSSTSTLGAAVTINPNSGAWTYDPSGVADFIALADGETLDDTFTYTVSDGNGGSSQNTVTITVTGINEDPTADDDTAATTANVTTGGSLSDLVDDPDTNDTLTYALTGDAPLGTVNLDPNTGAWTYDPSGVADFIALADGETLDDTFTYTVSDGHGGTDTATITITVTGVNEAPTANDDSAATSPSAAVDIALLANDTDPDTNDTLSVSAIDTTGTNGQVTDNGDGTVTYDPSGWAAAQALAPGASLDDTFTYTVSDGHGGSDTATVTVTVTGATTGDPIVSNPIPDRIINDVVDEPQTFTYDLDTVFSDDGQMEYSFKINKDGSIYNNSSTNDFVQVDLTGSLLSLTYDGYRSNMDTTEITIEVTATEVGGTGASISDEFVVTVTPEQTVDVQLVVRSTATPSDQLSTTTLPESLTTVAVGQTYIVEIWMTDLLDSSLTSGPISEGLGGGVFDISFNGTIGEGISLGHEGPFYSEQFPKFNTGDIEENLINDFGGVSGTVTGLGINGNYVRLGYVEFQATGTGDQIFSLDFDSMSRNSNEEGSTQVVTGSIAEAQVNMASITVSQQEVTTFTLDPSASIFADGVCFGQALQEQESSSSYAMLSGTIDVIINYDSEDNPISIMFVDATITVSYYSESLLQPGIGGEAGSATANFGLCDASSVVNLAVRDMIIGLTSDGPIMLSGVQINQSLINFTTSGGTVDYRSGLSPNTLTLDGQTLEDNGSVMGSLFESAGTLQLILDYDRIIDISDSTGVSGDYLQFSGNIAAVPASAALTAAETANTPASDQTDLVMTLSTSATALDSNGQVNTLPVSEAWIDEWTGFWVEVWARSGEGDGINAAKLDLAYNGDYFTAVEIEHGRGLTQNTSGDLTSDGIVVSLGGEAATTGLGTEEFVLVGRVRFEALADDQVPIDALDRVIGPHDLGLEISNAEITVEGVAEPQIVLGAAPETELWAVPYDVDDNDTIDLGDLAFFAAAYQSDVLDSESAFVWASDYDKSGEIDLGDLSFFATNYRCSKLGNSEIAYPESFLQRWIGSGLETKGDSTVSDVLDAAVDTWGDLLGIDEPIDIQLVVKDFGDDQLGEAQILEVDDSGRPIKGRITLDDDAAGMGWSTQLDGGATESLYDLYTVLLHEVGHTLGFTTQYEGFAENVESDGQGGLIFVGADFTAVLDASAQHLDAIAHPGDVMNSTLATGVRRLPSELTAEMLKTAYDTSATIGGGFSTAGSALYADSGLATQSTTLGEISTISTADISPLGDRLEGDVTWERLFNSDGDQPSLSVTDSVDRAVLDTVIDNITSGDFSHVGSSLSDDSNDVDFDTAELALQAHAAWTQDRLAAKKADDDIFAAIFTNWQDPLA